MADEKPNKIWIESKRLNFGDETSAISSVECIEVRPESQRKDVLNQIKEEFDINVDDKVLKLRNHRGSLIPINGNVPVNSKSMPYILEITSRHQNVIPKPKSVKLLSYDETVKKKIQDIIDRIDRLEVAALQLTARRNNRIEKEMKELDGMLEFLNKRLTEANGTKWKGMFKKNPLW
ncbi:hypothetical protein CHS0354_025935 [Potamilus streckersoni]|uniref:Uncharacterized protein n=1 Tax=Potamilus streckersoni TaxID=2493646 RepID=A0AAE0W5Y8_9BIVA|nr:hypothetical protein CHS0354_025935 [Potamilus streckersoni]